MTYRTWALPAAGRVTTQSWRSKGGSVLVVSSHVDGNDDRAAAHLNLDGKSLPAQRCILAFGESLPGLPWNFANIADSPLLSATAHEPVQNTATHPGTRFSHFMTSSHARSFKKLWIATIISILSSGVSHPFRDRAL